MHFKQLIKARYAVREYFENKVDRKLLQEVINAGRLAPSAANKQPWHFVAVDDEKILKQIRTAYERDWFYKVPAMIIIYGDHKASWKRSYDQKDHCDIDVAISIDHMTLMATELGLGTCWVCHFNPEVINEIIEKEDHWEPVAILTIGYPIQTKAPDKMRKDINEVMSFNKF